MTKKEIRNEIVAGIIIMLVAAAAAWLLLTAVVETEEGRMLKAIQSQSHVLRFEARRVERNLR